MPRAFAPSRRAAMLGGVAVVLFAFAALISIVVFSQSALSISSAAPGEADARFADVRRRFADSRPLLEFSADDGPTRMIVHRDRVPATSPAATTVWGLAWRASDGSLARVRLPMWFVRMKLAGGRVSLGALLPDGWDLVSVSADDLVRHGAGLLLDERRPNGDRLLLWAE